MNLYLGADAKSGHVFCSECDDFIFDDILDELYLHTVVSVEERNTKFQGAFSNESRGHSGF